MLKTRNITLRDFIESDIEKRIHWETIETEWQLWDAPWEYEGMTEADKAEELARYVRMLQSFPEKYRKMPSTQRRSMFQIDTNIENPRYIGWVSSYRIDDAYCYTKGSGHCTVGINIPDPSARGKGYAYEALYLFITYLLNQGEPEIYTQTWSGNERMIHIAEKIGFEECCRKKDLRLVRGTLYDGLTFRLNCDRFAIFLDQIARKYHYENP